MPAVRLARRRRSSLAISFTPAKAGIYGIPRPVTFAPNVTPITYEAPEGSSSSSTPEPSSPTSALFPPSETPAPPPSRRRVPPGKRRSMGYIPRPPNAFMLFRADFVRQKHVPGTIETNHGSLSKIIGNCWRSLPLEEKRVWEVKAKHAKAEHKARYPEYRFRPVHNKNKDKKKEKALTTVEDERRCEEVAQLLLEGKKGDELAAAVRDLDLMRAETPSRHTNTNTHQDQQQPVFHHRRSSSVPLPNDYYPHFPGMPFQPAPFFAPGSRPPTPLARQQRMMLGSRRASSARPATGARSWTLPLPGTTATMLQRDDSPLPDVDTSLFEPSFLDAAAGFTFPVYDNHHQHQQQQQQQSQFDMSMHMNGYEHGQSQGSFGPLDNISPHDILAYANTSSPYHSPDSSLSSSLSSSSYNTSSSHPSTAYSGSPAYSEPLPLPLPLPLPHALPHPNPLTHPNAHPHELPMPIQVHAPQPQSASAAFADMWKEFGGGSFSSDPALGMHMGVEGVFNVDGMGLGLGLEFGGNGNGNGGQEVQVDGGGAVGGMGGMDMGCVPQQGLGQGENVFGGAVELELESLFAPQGYDGAYEQMEQGMGMGMGMAA
ncbi:Repressor ROX1 [Hypsizygus marmoreus]|uniref:Repressor ROX1 n=1 Tax=Hypsizygus marmoreus TaxID=39966 RepID=A0A369JZ09_HYPMA|nr:Repressor ROX1 [Hypsizygus marmoreus]